jgi:hypothetical protein
MWAGRTIIEHVERGRNRMSSWLVGIVTVAAVSMFGYLSLVDQRSPSAAHSSQRALTPRVRRMETRPVVEQSVVRSIAGTVRSELGNAIGAASVCASEPCEGCDVLPVCTHTDDSGRFVLTGVSPVSLLWASAPGHLAHDERLNPEARRFRSDQGLVHLVLRTSAANIIGTVSDATGGPIPRALVTAWSGAPRHAVARTLTSSDGTYALGVEGESLEISADADGYARASRWVHAPASDIALVLAPSSSIAGQLVHESTGEPLGGVPIVADGRNGLRHHANGRTAPDGRFLLSPLPAGGYAVSALAAELRSSEVWVRLNVGEVSDSILLTATRAMELRGSIHVGGEPCSGGTLSLRGPLTASAVTDAEGMASIPGLLPGRYSVDVSCEPALPVREEIDVVEGSFDRRWDLKLGREVRGRVVNPEGNPVAAARVGVQPIRIGDDSAAKQGEHRLVECLSDAQGEFVCRGLADGEHQCALLDRFASVVRVTVGPGEVSAVVLRAEASGTIRLRIPNVGRQRLSEMVAYASGDSNPLVAGRPVGDSFVFEHLLLGTYRVFLGSPSNAEAPPPQVKLERDGEIAELEIAAPSLTTISGRVVDERGEPVVDAWVRVSIAESVAQRPTTVGHPVLTNDEGQFAVERLVAGRYDISVSSSVGDNLVSDVQGGDQQVLVRLPTYGSLAGVVKTEGGARVPGFDLDCIQKEGAHQRAVGLDGRWSLPWLAPGEYAVAVSSALGSATQTVVLAAGERRKLDMTLHGAASSRR